MIHRRIALWALTCSCIFAANAPAGADANGGSSAPLTSQDEIVIAAQREKLSQLRAQIAKSEDEFFDAYNRINTVREFDVHCSADTLRDSHISKRVCTPRFVQDAQENAAANILAARTSGGVQAAPHGQGADPVINSKALGYSRHLVEVASTDPKLRKMLHDYDSLRKHYDAVRKEKLHGRLMYWGD